MILNERGGPAAWRGGALARAEKHQAALIFFVLFASRQKGQKKNKVRTPLKFW